MPVTRPLGQVPSAAWIAVLCLLGTLASGAARRITVFAAILAVGAVSIELVAWFAFERFLWVPSVPVMAGWLLAAVLSTALVSRREALARAELMQMFAASVSPLVADRLWENRHALLVRGRPRTERLTATVLFTDLRDFTSVAERLEPEVLVPWLNDYLAAMARLVIGREGLVDKFIGDSLMAVFGLPVPRTSPDEWRADAVAAVDCALAMAETLAQLNRDWASRDLPAAQMRIGISTGPVVAGVLGSAERRSYTAIGDTVNIASRLESYDKSFRPDLPCRTLIASATAELVRDRFELEPLGLIETRGRSAPVEVFLVRGRRSQSSA
jgi:adenylate cyclase